MFAALVLVAACGKSEPTGIPQAIATSSTTADDLKAIDGPVMRYPTTASTSGGLTTLLQGVLEVEGECLYLVQDAISQRFPIVWPAGTHWDAPTRSVVSPAGAVMPLGAAVEGRGGYFYLSDVNHLAGAAAWNLASKCVESIGQIAVVDNSAAAIGPQIG